MITIEQLLESVDLDFEPRWVTQDAAKHIEFWSEKPKVGIGSWRFDVEGTILSSMPVRLKIAEFDGKDWTECIYEVPQKEELKDKIKIGTLYIDKSVTFGDGDDDDVGVALECCEVPRKTDEYEQNLEKLRPADSDLVYRVKLPRKTTGKIEKLTGLLPIVNGRRKIVFPSDVSQEDIISKLHEVIDAVNELKGAKNE